MKSKKGITLIALVITIVVMLILVGVTVSVSLNGGLFSTAKEATDETQTAKESEELLMAAMGALGENGEVDLSKLDNSLPQGFQKTETGAYKSTTTGNIFTVATNGKITLEGSSSEEEPETPVTPPQVQTQISFTIDGTTYYAEEGMTWKEWCEDSTYCTLTGVTCEVVISYNSATLIDSNQVTVESSAEIESGAAYSFSHSGGQ